MCYNDVDMKAAHAPCATGYGTHTLPPDLWVHLLMDSPVVVGACAGFISVVINAVAAPSVIMALLCDMILIPYLLIFSRDRHPGLCCHPEPVSHPVVAAVGPSCSLHCFLHSLGIPANC